MDLSESPHEFLALRRSSYITTLEDRREELHLKPTPELRKIIRTFRKIMEAEA